MNEDLKPMHPFDPDLYRQAGAAVRTGLAHWDMPVSAEALGHVRHYLDHGEYEMALESFLLAAMEEGIPCPASAAEELTKLCHLLGLMDDEAVFAADFPERAERYLGGR